MAEDRLTLLLQRHESRTLDFKREQASSVKIARTLVAYANTAGGILALGVGDDRSPLGLSDAALQEERVANLVSDGIEPPLDLDTEVVRHAGVDLLLITVHRLPGPFYVRSEGPDAGVYVRQGSTNRVASPEKREELRRLALAKSFDQRPCHGATLDDLDLDAVDRAFRPSGRVLDGAALASLELVTDAGGRFIPTNAGLLLFGTPAARQRFFPGAAFRCARFLGTAKVDFLDQFDPEGSVLEALDAVEKFVRRNTRTAARIESLRRQNVPEYATIHLREILANAIAHTDYSQRGMNLRVAIFDDRMEVENPGGWPVGFTEDDFKAGISRPRNPAIADILRRLDVIEKWGTGYRRIQNASEGAGYPLPTWSEMGSVLRVTLRPHPEVTLPSNSGRYSATADGRVNGTEDHLPSLVSERPGGPLSDRQQWMLLELAQGRPAVAEDIMVAFGVSERTARRDIRGLRERKLITFDGPFKTGRYVLMRGGSDPPPP